MTGSMDLSSRPRPKPESCEDDVNLRTPKSHGFLASAPAVLGVFAHHGVLQLLRAAKQRKRGTGWMVSWKAGCGGRTSLQESYKPKPGR